MSAYNPGVADETLLNSNRGATYWLNLNESAFLEDVRIEHYRGPGPGGQKRNKTSNSVRLTHEPTGVQVVASESRSAALNELHALRRLKLKLAATLRTPIDPRDFEPPAWWQSVMHSQRIAVAERNPLYALTGAFCLDLLDAMHGSAADAAALLGVSTSSLVKFLHGESSLWAAANSIRKVNGKPPLRHA